MKYQLTDGPEGLAIFLSNSDDIDLPQYNFVLPENHLKDFEEMGIYELMEGIYELPSKPLEEIQKFLEDHGYKESKESL